MKRKTLKYFFGVKKKTKKIPIEIVSDRQQIDSKMLRVISAF